MARPASKSPTDAELAILRVLWERGPSTVRDVYEALKRSRDAGYTSVLKVMQIMHDKGLVARDEAKRSHVYRAAVPREHTQRQIVGDLLERVFGGSARALVLQALSARRASPKELAEIRKLLDEFEGGKR
jgi:BlaI family transcriptional regulator, penicillinase repressor